MAISRIETEIKANFWSKLSFVFYPKNPKKDFQAAGEAQFVFVHLCAVYYYAKCTLQFRLEHNTAKYLFISGRKLKKSNRSCKFVIGPVL